MAQITAFVIPNAVRNLARKKKEILRFALNDKLMVNCQLLCARTQRDIPPAPLQRGEERSEAHEALTFWLLLGQAKSNGKNTLNNKRNE